MADPSAAEEKDLTSEEAEWERGRRKEFLARVTEEGARWGEE